MKFRITKEVISGLLLLVAPSFVHSLDGGIQIPGPIYAGGIKYSQTDNNVYFTGSRYEDDGDASYTQSDCFLGEVSLSSSDSKSTTTTLKTIGQATDIPEACSSLVLEPDGDRSSRAFLIGNSENGGFDGTTDSTKTQFGNLIEVELGAGSTDDDMLEIENMAIGDQKVTYPISIAVNEGSSSNNVYIVSSESSTDATTSANDDIEQHEYPNLIPFNGLRRFGSGYEVRFTKFDVVTNEVVVEKTFATSDGLSVYPAGIGVVDGGHRVVVVGSTRGSGGEFGNTKVGAGLDGFAMLLDASTGTAVTQTKFIDATDQDHYVTQICTDPNDSDIFYVVGARTLIGSSEFVLPFVVKMKASTLETVWSTDLQTTQPESGESRRSRVRGRRRRMVFSGQTFNGLHEEGINVGSASSSAQNTFGASAYGCVVGDGNRLYVAGTAYGGAEILSDDTLPQPPFGMDDIFVAQMDSGSGQQLWARQVGTAQNDSVGQGGCIDMDGDGNVLILGQTEGTLFESSTSQQRKLQTGTTDLVLFSISLSGEIGGSVSDPGAEDGTAGTTEPAPVPAPAPVPVPPPVPAPTEPAPVPPPTEPVTEPAPVATPTVAEDKPVAAPTVPEDKPMSGSVTDAMKEKLPAKSIGIILGAICGVLLLCCCLVTCVRARRRAEDRSNQRQMLSIFKYLHVFDVDDIDIRRSPAGGYHATYLNDLVNGDNTVTSSDIGSKYSDNPRGITHASVVDDYMFMSSKNLSSDEKFDDDDSSQTGLSGRL